MRAVMKIRIDYDLCEGNAVCMKVCPEVFEVGDDDRARLRIKEPDENLRAKVEAAVRRCPRQALSIEVA
jgi:ferredoxin